MEMLSFALPLFVVLTFLSNSFADKTANSSGVFVQVLGTSGKIYISRKEDPSSNASVVVQFSEIKEKDTNGTTVGLPKHSLDTFAGQNFSFSEVANGWHQNLSVVHFNFAANLTSVNAQLMTVMYIFTQAGNITVGNETTEVESGSVKFNIEIKNWAFCGTGNVTCSKGNTDEVGAFIDFGIEIKGKGNVTKENDTIERKNRTRGDSYDLGDGAKLIMSKKVNYDNTSWTDMPDGYPNVASIGGKQIFNFRFLKFNNSVLYDPTIKLGQDNTSASVDNGTSNMREKNLQEGKVYANILGRSGKITIGSTSNPASDPDRVTIELDGIQEFTSNGTQINDTDHSFNNFANQDFTFTSVMNSTFQNVSASMFNFSVIVGSKNASVVLSVYIFKENGTLSLNGETTTVRAGTVKFNIQVNNWNFCSNATICTASAIGEHLDLYVTIKGKGEKPLKLEKKKFSNGDEYTLGGNSYLVMSKKVKLDDNWTDMPQNYPLIMLRGNKQTFIIRMKKFNNTSFYDPNVEIGITDDSTSGGTSGALKHIISMTFIFVTTILSLCITRLEIFH